MRSDVVVQSDGVIQVREVGQCDMPSWRKWKAAPTASCRDWLTRTRLVDSVRPIMIIILTCILQWPGCSLSRVESDQRYFTGGERRCHEPNVVVLR